MSKLPKLPTLKLPSLPPWLKLPTRPPWARTRQGMVLAATFVAALLVGLAAFVGAAIFSPEDNSGFGLSVSNVRVTQFSPRSDNQIDAIVDMVWNKTGAPAKDCVAQLMLKSGKVYRYGSSDKQTVTLADEGQQQITIDLPFRFPREEYVKRGMVRVVCASPTASPWVSVSMPEWTP